MGEALRHHWPEYLMEAAGLGIFMVSACAFGVLLWHPASPLARAIPDGVGRRALMGVAMAATAAGIIYSPWGQQSGAHINPAVTLAFFWLGKVRAWDAFFYVAAQFLGGLAGVVLSARVLGRLLADPAVGFVATLPGPSGARVAFAAEAGISFVLMMTVLATSSRPGLARFTGLFAAALVALYITFEAPLSGMSMNPARTVASALPAGVWAAAWVYFLAPPLGMLAAAETFSGLTQGRAAHCAKLNHDNPKRCIFCSRAEAGREP